VRLSEVQGNAFVIPHQCIHEIMRTETGVERGVLQLSQVNGAMQVGLATLVEHPHERVAVAKVLWADGDLWCDRCPTIDRHRGSVFAEDEGEGEGRRTIGPRGYEKNLIWAAKCVDECSRFEELGKFDEVVQRYPPDCGLIPGNINRGNENARIVEVG